jgi:hypothetical protein
MALEEMTLSAEVPLCSSGVAAPLPFADLPLVDATLFLRADFGASLDPARLCPEVSVSSGYSDGLLESIMDLQLFFSRNLLRLFS